MKHEPAHSIIARLGGPRVVAGVVGKDLSRVYRWMYPRSRGGTEGIIPFNEAQKLLEHAKASGVDLTPADFFSVADATRALSVAEPSAVPLPAAASGG